MSDDRVSILDVFLACESIARHLFEFDREAFGVDDKTQDSVMHQLTILGEAVGRLTQEFRLKHAEIDWSGYVGLRNVLIHQYDRVNLDLVWTIATEEIPELKVWIEQNSLIEPPSE
jgi:uncharacterized protein with HEPN domain